MLLDMLSVTPQPHLMIGRDFERKYKEGQGYMTTERERETDRQTEEMNKDRKKGRKRKEVQGNGREKGKHMKKHSGEMK